MTYAGPVMQATLPYSSSCIIFYASIPYSSLTYPDTYPCLFLFLFLSLKEKGKMEVKYARGDVLCTTAHYKTEPAEEHVE